MRLCAGQPAGSNRRGLVDQEHTSNTRSTTPIRLASSFGTLARAFLSLVEGRVCLARRLCTIRSAVRAFWLRFFKRHPLALVESQAPKN